MSNFRTAFKRKVKPTNDVLKSQIYQAIKVLSKEIKLVKTFLILKYTKKLALKKESIAIVDDKTNKEIEKLNSLKMADHSLIAAIVVQMKVSFGSDQNYNPITQSMVDKVDKGIISLFLKQKRILGTIEKVQSKITSTIEKNNQVRYVNEQSNISNEKQKSIFTKRTISTIAATQAVFVGSLDEEQNDSKRKMPCATDLVKLNKSLRNQQNRMANKVKKTQTGNNIQQSSAYNERKGRRSYDNDNDPSLMMYKPLDQRFSSVSTISTSKSTSNSNSKSTNSNVNKSNYNANKPFRVNDSNTANHITRTKNSTKVTNATELQPNLKEAVVSGKEWQKNGVHPSWAAKQQKKQQSMIVGAIPSVNSLNASTAAKKIIFDD